LGLKTIGGGFASWSSIKTRHGQFGGLCLKTIRSWFDQFEPQNQGVVDRRTHGVISKFASRRSNVVEGTGFVDLDNFASRGYLVRVLRVRKT
jgi:hypothetical protein